MSPKIRKAKYGECRVCHDLTDQFCYGCGAFACFKHENPSKLPHDPLDHKPKPLCAPRAIRA